MPRSKKRATPAEILAKVEKTLAALERVPATSAVHELHALLTEWREHLVGMEKQSATKSAELS